MLNWLKKGEHYKNLLKISIKSNIWSCKFTTNSNLKKKIDNYRLKKVERVYKNRKNNYKIWWYWNQKTNFTNIKDLFQ